MGLPPEWLFFIAPRAWGIGEQSTPNIWCLLDTMEELQGGGEGGNGGTGLRFSLRFDPMRAGFDHTLLSFPVSALISRLLGWSKNSMMVRKAGGESAGSVAVVAAAVGLYLAALVVSDQQPRRPRRRRLAASAMARTNSAARPRALPAPDDGLRILSSHDGSLENVIHSASIGPGEDEPVLVARVLTMPPDVAGGAHADGEMEHGRSEIEQEEAEQLNELWLSLVEREKRLELRVKEIDGLREQEATARAALENRVAVAAVETRLRELKVFSLLEENERLRAEASELDAVRAKLGRAKEKLRALTARVEGEQEEARREAAALRERVTELEMNGEERARALAAEAAALRKANAGLEEEKRELALRLQDAEHVASSVNLVLEEDVVEEANCLRETNERLTSQIEQLHADHCAHVEELVYLKWVNACLRHELGGHDQHHSESSQQDQQDGCGAGEMSAMDLSRSMSYRSGEKAKQLMLQFGNLGLDGFDPDLFSPLHESLYGGSNDGDHHPRGGHGEPGPSPDIAATMAAVAAAPGKRTGHGKLKFLGNIKKLLTSSRRSHGHGDRKSKKAPPRDEHHEKAMRWLSASHDALDGDNSCESTSLSSCERTPLSSVTTVDSRARVRGGERDDQAAVPEAAASGLEAPETLARSKSDAGASSGWEASRYHALRPDHPAGVGLDGRLRAPEKVRRYSDDLRSSSSIRLLQSDMLTQFNGFGRNRCAR